MVDETMRRIENSSVGSKLARLRKNGQLSDLTFVLEDGNTIAAHRTIVSMYSSIIALKCGQYSNTPHLNYQCSDIDCDEPIQSDVLNLLLDFMYGQTIEVPNDLVTTLRTLAKKLKVKELVKALDEQQKRGEEDEAMEQVISDLTTDTYDGKEEPDASGNADAGNDVQAEAPPGPKKRKKTQPDIGDVIEQKANDGENKKNDKEGSKAKQKGDEKKGGNCRKHRKKSKENKVRKESTDEEKHDKHTPKKDKKNRKRKQQNAEEDNDISHEVVKKKSKKNKKDNASVDHDVEKDDDCMSSTVKNKKKHAKKAQVVEEFQENEAGEQVASDKQMKKKKSKKNKKSSKDNDESEALVDGQNNANENGMAEKRNLSHNEIEVNGTVGSNVGQWGTASFEDQSRQDKFLRLMGGGMKKSGAKSGPFKWSNAGASSLGKQFQALNRDKANELEKKLEDQFEKARDFLVNKDRGIGLGFEKDPSEGKKLHIDTMKSKSMKFND